MDAEALVRPVPSIPIGPRYWDEMWDGHRGVGGHYLPNGQRCSMREWVYNFETSNATNHRKAFRHRRQVAQSFVGPYRVSTVYLGLDHNWAFGGRPLIFETMVFERKRSYRPPTENMPGYSYHEDIDNLSDRYCTRDEALRGHWVTRKLVRRWLQLANGPAGGWRGKK